MDTIKRLPIEEKAVGISASVNRGINEIMREKSIFSERIKIRLDP